MKKGMNDMYIFWRLKKDVNEPFFVYFLPQRNGVLVKLGDRYQEGRWYREDEVEIINSEKGE